MLRIYLRSLLELYFVTAVLMSEPYFLQAEARFSRVTVMFSLFPLKSKPRSHKLYRDRHLMGEVIGVE